MAMQLFGAIQCIPRLSVVSVVTYKYGLLDIDIAVTGRASNFWEAHKSCIDFPLCSREDQEWFSTKFIVWGDTRDPSFMFDLSLPASAELPLSTDVLRDYTLEFKITVEWALIDLGDFLRKAVGD